MDTGICSSALAQSLLGSSCLTNSLLFSLAVIIHISRVDFIKAPEKLRQGRNLFLDSVQDMVSKMYNLVMSVFLYNLYFNL